MTGLAMTRAWSAKPIGSGQLRRRSGEGTAGAMLATDSSVKSGVLGNCLWSSSSAPRSEGGSQPKSTTRAEQSPAGRRSAAYLSVGTQTSSMPLPDMDGVISISSSLPLVTSNTRPCVSPIRLIIAVAERPVQIFPAYKGGALVE